jgi:hypothetical protein
MTVPRSLVTVLLLLAAAPLATTPLGAQIVPSSCDYVTCSLRIEGGGFMRRDKLLRGSSNEEVATLGTIAPDLEAVFAPDPEASALARSYRTRNNWGFGLGVVGVLTASVGAMQLLTLDETGSVVASAGLGLVLGGSFLMSSARGALNDAVRDYNAGLPGTR